MKYIVRSVKYFIYFSLLCTAIVAALVVIGAVEGNIDFIFQEGYRSVAKIAVFFAVVAAVYPYLGFITRSISVNDDWESIRERTVEYMKERRYCLESESPDKVTFRFRGISGKIAKMYEDRLTLSRGLNGWVMEGLRKDVIRISTGLENLLSPADTTH